MFVEKESTFFTQFHCPVGLIEVMKRSGLPTFVKTVVPNSELPVSAPETIKLPLESSATSNAFELEAIFTQTNEKLESYFAMNM